MSAAALKDKPFTRSDGRRFGLVVGGAFLALAGLSLWRGRGLYVVLGLAALGALLVFGGLLVPARLGPPYRAWMGLAKVLAPVMTPVFMAVMYFVVLTPVAALRRMIGGNPLVARGTESFWIERTRSGRSSMERQF